MDNEKDNKNNFFIEQNEEKENLEEDDDDSNDLLDHLLNKSEKKNKNALNKKRNRNEKLNNVIELNENYEIISDFAPTRKELFEKLFSKDFSENLDYNKKKIKIYFNPEEYAKKNELNQFFFNGEELINSVIENNNEENKKLFNNKIKTQKDNLIIEKKADNYSYQNKNPIKIEKENKKETFHEIKKEKEIQRENEIVIKNEIKKEMINQIKEEKEIKKDKLFDKIELDNKKEIDEEKEFEFYNLNGYLKREKIKEYLLEFYNLKHPNYKERIKYSKLIYKISQLCPEKKEKKLNFVFDLDCTLICAKSLEFNKLKEIKEKYKSLGEYYQFIEVYNNAFQIQNNIVNYRNGIKSMFNKIKDISNLYIYSLSLGQYSETIKQYIEQLCNVKFEKLIYYEPKPNKKEEKKKYFRNLKLSHFNTLIFDDIEDDWIDNTIRHKCIINSMSYYCNKTYLIANQTYLIKKDIELNPSFYFNVITSENEKWLENLMIYERINPFKEISSERYYHIETENSNKKQLEYIGNVYATVYNIMEFMNFDTICAMDAIKMIRITLFGGMIFDISNYEDDSYKILKFLIISNGGEIFNGNNYYDDADYIYICNKNIWENNSKDIENKKSQYNNFHLINEKYIFDCSFCMTKFSLEEPEYILFEQ